MLGFLKYLLKLFYDDVFVRLGCVLRVKFKFSILRAICQDQRVSIIISKNLSKSAKYISETDRVMHVVGILLHTNIVNKDDSFQD